MLDKIAGEHMKNIILIILLKLSVLCWSIGCQSIKKDKITIQSEPSASVMISSDSLSVGTELGEPLWK